jgi:hypothetical protein
MCDRAKSIPVVIQWPKIEVVWETDSLGVHNISASSAVAQCGNAEGDEAEGQSMARCDRVADHEAVVSRSLSRQ